VSVLFAVLAVLLILGALGTVSLANAVHASLSLVGTLLTLALLYVTLNAHFLASVQVIVYAGAIMVLFLFVIMLLDAAHPVTAPDPMPWLRYAAMAGSLALAAALTVLAFTFRAPRPLAVADAALQGGAPGPIGEVLFTRFLLPFEAVSILLLVAVVGAVALVRRDPGVLPGTDPAALAEEPVSGLGTPETNVGRTPRARVKGNA
jgi:NADH-quinone oxidoreductase subunit J